MDRAPPSFLTTAAEIALAPFIAREETREDVRRRHYETDARRSSGVSWSGMGPQPINPRTPEQIRHDAEVACARATAFAESPRGRFLLAIRRLQDLGYAAQAERARSACGRGFASPDTPACAKEVGVAVAVIAPIDHPDARSAVKALGELLATEQKVAA